MADKTTTLKTKTNDNVYPNVIGDNRDNAIVDSAHIKHTLTADHKINFRIDDNVSNLIFNSLQKPAGLTKTELVGVGANGQENIEIGDNLTLANGKLSATGGGSSKVGTIVLDETQSEAFNNRSFSFTEEQLNIIKSNDYIYLTLTIKIDNNSLIQTIYLTKGTSKIETGGESIMQYSLYYIIGDVFNILFFSDDGSVSFYNINSIDTYVQSVKINGNNLNIRYTEPSSSSGYAYSISRINNKLLLGGDGENFQLTEDKPVPLFAKYNVLVPKDSPDTNILPLPSDSSTSTYVLKAVNGTVQWVKES